MDNVLDIVLLFIHALLLLLRPHSRVNLIQLVNNKLSSLEIDGSLNALGAVRLGDQKVLHEDVLRESRLLTGHILQLKVDSSLEGGCNVGSNLPAGFPPCADSQGVEVGGVGPGVGQHSDGSHADLLSLSHIFYQC